MTSKPTIRIFLLFLFTISINSSEPFVHYQTLNQTSQFSNVFDASQNHEVLVVGSSNDPIQIFHFDGQYFNLNQTIAQVDQIRDLDLTTDGKWILISYWNGFAKVYKQNQETYQFEDFQTLNEKINEGTSKAGIISDDHQWVIFSLNGKAQVYNFKENKFFFHQQLEVSSQISDIDIAKDTSFLMFANKNKGISLYRFFQGNFYFNKTIGQIPNGSKKIYLSHDKNSVIITNTLLNEINILVYNQTVDEFQFHESNGTLIMQNVKYSEISSDNKWMGISNKQNIELFAYFPNQKMRKVQVIDCPSYYQKFSMNSQLFIVECNQSIQVFNLNCSKSENQFYNIDQKECKQCQATNCLVCHNLTYCHQCRPGYRKNNETEQCNKIEFNETDSLEEEQSCNKDQNEFLFNKICVKCSIQGCIKCANLQKCELCDASYMLENSECKKNKKYNAFIVSMIVVVGFLVVSYLIYFHYRIKTGELRLAQIVSTQAMKNNEL